MQVNKLISIGRLMTTKQFLAIQIPKRLLSDDDDCGGLSLNRNVQQVTGLSRKVLDKHSEDVGPGAAKFGLYKNSEYYSFHNMSYYEAIVELKKYRLPQPSSHKK